MFVFFYISLRMWSVFVSPSMIPKQSPTFDLLELMKQGQRDIRAGQRDIQRAATDLQRKEKELVSTIRVVSHIIRLIPSP